MLMLALDTSTREGSVALGAEEEVLAESQLPVRATHSETVLPEIDRLLRACGRHPDELEGVVVGAGPGSFTGVRIAASIAKGMVFAGGARLYAYSSLAAVAAGSGVQGKVCAALDARRGQVYAAGFRLASRLEPLFPPAALTLQELLDRVGPAEGWRFAVALPSELRERLVASGGQVLPPHLGIPRASSLLWLARTDPEAGRVRDPRDWEPEYVRLPGALRGLS